MLLVSIDTSTKGCSVAVHNNGEVLVSYDLYKQQSSSALLTTLIQNAVDHAGFTFDEVDAFAIAKGPGSYTGLRVGVSTAKGLCYSLDKPLVAVNTLEAMAMQIADFYEPDILLCPMLDARRMEVYCAVYDNFLTVRQPTQACIVDENSFADLLSEHRVAFFGDGASKCRTVFQNNSNALFSASTIAPSAKTVGQLASIAYSKGQFENVSTFEPYYLKDFMGTQPKKKQAIV
jgi:tRNA threonylcarbamoyladenosine biosynthesis protein TsaB